MHFRTDPEFVRQVQDEMYRQKAKVKPYVVKLPCGHGRAQVDAPSSDLIKIQCYFCKKTHYLIWSPTGKHKFRNE